MRGKIETILMLLVLGVLIFVLIGMGGANFNIGLEDRAHQAAEQEGYTDLVSYGYEYWACGSDAMGFNFEATNPAGARVMITACTDHGVFGINKSWWIVSR